MNLEQTHSKEPEEELTCELCDSMKTIHHQEVTSKTKRELFHTECHKCHMETDSLGPLCPFCRHLQLRHLLLCVKPGDDLHPVVDLGTWGRLSTTKDCAFCSFVSEAISENLSSYDKDKIGLHSSCHIALPLTAFQWELDSPRVHLWLETVRTPGRDDIIIFYQDCAPNTIFEPLQMHADTKADESKRGPFRVDRAQLVQSFANWDRVRAWIDGCATEHSRCINQRLGILPSEFRVIDITRRCLVRGVPDQGYVALSYIWGSNPDITMWTALRSTIQELHEDGGLAQSRTPRTIEDAMLICKKIGERYLWADRLCIVQDDEDDKKSQIQSMTDIYTSAKVTIVVLEGTVDTGIPGVNSPRRMYQNTHELSGLSLTYSLPKFDVSVGNSCWETRGWTYQEAVLSRRKLYFSECQALYECNAIIVTEDESSDGRFRDPFINMKRKRLLLHDGQTRFNCWTVHLENYTARRLSNRSDIFDALTGIASAIYGNYDNFLYGIPRADFDSAILWYPLPLMSRANGTCARAPDTDQCPSWSWASITGQVTHNRYLIGSIAETLVRWKSKMREGRLQDLELVRTYQTSNTRDEHRQEDFPHIQNLKLLAIAWSFGCLETKWPFKCLSQSTFSEMESNLRSLLPQSNEWRLAWADMLPNPMETLERPSLKHDLISNAIFPGVLVTRAQSATFRLRPHYGHSRCDERQRWREIVNGKNEAIGILKSVDPVLTPYLVESEAEIECIGLSLSGESEVECVVPELRGSNKLPGSYWDMSPRDRIVERLDLAFSDEEGYTSCETSAVNVVAIRRHGPYAYRMAIGWILLKRWVQTERQFKDILLR